MRLWNRYTRCCCCCCCCFVTSNQFSIGARTFPARSFPPDGTTFSQITLGQKLSKQIPPYSYWNMQFYQNEAAYVKFDYNIPRGASIGVYARRNALPTHTQYHFKEVLSGINPNPARVARSTHVSFTEHFLSLSLLNFLARRSFSHAVVSWQKPCRQW